MDQSRVKLSVAALGILAFVLSYFGYLELLFLLIAYAVFLDKSQPLARMSFQALYLHIAYRVILLVLGWIFGFFGWIFNLGEVYGAISGISSWHNYINTLISLLFFVACLLAVIQIISKKTCNLPLLNSLADKTLGLITPKTQPQPQYHQPVQPYQAQVTPPPAQSASAPAAPVTPVQSAPTPPAAPASGPTAWTCGCGHENHGNFCMKCGSPKPK